MTDKLRELTLLALDSHGCERLKDFYECGPVQRAAVETFLEAALAQQDAQAVRSKFLANGTRFKMSFFQNEDGEGNTVPGTHVTCFEAFEDELDERWVALVPAEDDCHLNAAPTPPAQTNILKP